MYEMEGALLDPFPIQAGRFAWQHRLRCGADRRGQSPASGSGFPVPSASPGFPLGRCPFPTWMYFYSWSLARRKSPGVATGDIFRYPQDEGGYPPVSGVIHRLVHSISTGHRLLPARPLPQPQQGPQWLLSGSRHTFSTYVLIGKESAERGRVRRGDLGLGPA